MKRNLFLGISAAETDRPIITLNLRVQTIGGMQKNLPTKDAMDFSQVKLIDYKTVKIL